MRGKRFRTDQIIGILKEADAGVKVTELCRKYGMSDATFYNWKANFKRNHEIKTGRHSRFELSDPENYYSPKLVKETLFRLLSGLNGKRGIERCNHMKKYIKDIVYAPEEIGIKLIYKDFSVEDAENLIVNNPHSVVRPNAAKCRGARRAGNKDKKNFSDFLEEFGSRVVENILNYFLPIYESNEVHKKRAKTLVKQLANRQS